MSDINYSEITPEILALAAKCQESTIDPTLYDKYEVKRGLRDLNGHGVLTGLTEVGEIEAYITKDGVSTPTEGHLYY